jgi:membrane protease YdiL (CAAX protease family)
MVSEAKANSRKFALIALSVFLIDRAITSLIWVYREHVPFLRNIPAIPITGVVFSWLLPIIIVYVVEKRDLSSLGLRVGREKYTVYALCTFVGLVLPIFVVGLNRGLIVEFVEQLVYIGVAEELFFRGYLMGRFCEWLGDRRGLLLNAIVFGSAHIISRLSQHGLKYPVYDALNGFQTFMGGLLLGYIYLKSGDIVIGTIFHVSTNAYISRLLKILNM